VYYYQEFTRKLLESHPESGSGNYLEGTGNSGLRCDEPYQGFVADRALDAGRSQEGPWSAG
jgi:hypothetical protein